MAGKNVTVFAFVTSLWLLVYWLGVLVLNEKRRRKARTEPSAEESEVISPLLKPNTVVLQITCMWCLAWSMYNIVNLLKTNISVDESSALEACAFEKLIEGFLSASASALESAALLFLLPQAGVIQKMNLGCVIAGPARNPLTSAMAIFIVQFVIRVWVALSVTCPQWHHVQATKWDHLSDQEVSTRGFMDGAFGMMYLALFLDLLCVMSTKSKPTDGPTVALITTGGATVMLPQARISLYFSGLLSVYYLCMGLHCMLESLKLCSAFYACPYLLGELAYFLVYFPLLYKALSMNTARQ